MQTTGANCLRSFSDKVSQEHQLQSITNLAQAGCDVIADYLVGDGGIRLLTNTISATQLQRFYRVAVTPTPQAGDHAFAYARRTQA
jgi:hypothetical protein